MSTSYFPLHLAFQDMHTRSPLMLSRESLLKDRRHSGWRKKCNFNFRYRFNFRLLNCDCVLL